MDYAYLWSDRNKIVLESDYPYTSSSGEVGTCETTATGVMSADGFSFVPDRSSFQLQAALLWGPVAAAIDTSSTAFQQYSSGVLTET